MHKSYVINIYALHNICDLVYGYLCGDVWLLVLFILPLDDYSSKIGNSCFVDKIS